MQITRALVGFTGAGALAAGMLTAAGPAHATTGSCEDNIGYRISSPAGYGETGWHTVVIGLTAVVRTVTLVAGDGSGCTFEVGDHWSVDTVYFRAEGSYDGTAASLTDDVLVGVPASDTEVGFHRVVVTLDDVSGNDNDIVDESLGLYLKRRTYWLDFNVYHESPTPACGVISGTTLHGKGQLRRASWSLDAYRPYTDRSVRLLASPGHTAYHDLDYTVDTDVTDSSGWASFTFRPGYDATYFAHYGGNTYAGHSDSSQDYVNCS